MGRKATLNGILIGLVALALALLVIVLAFIGPFSSGSERITIFNLCRGSVAANAAAHIRAFGFELFNDLGENIELMCPTLIIPVKKGDEYTRTAREMQYCYNQYGAGNWEIFDTESGNFCAVCSRLIYRENPGVAKLNDYLMTTEAYDGRTYFEEFTGDAPTDAAKQDIDKALSAAGQFQDNDLAVVFVMNKAAANDADAWRLYGTAGGLAVDLFSLGLGKIVKTARAGLFATKATKIAAAEAAEAAAKAATRGMEARIASGLASHTAEFALSGSEVMVTIAKQDAVAKAAAAAGGRAVTEGVTAATKKAAAEQLTKSAAARFAETEAVKISADAAQRIEASIADQLIAEGLILSSDRAIAERIAKEAAEEVIGASAKALNVGYQSAIRSVLTRVASWVFGGASTGRATGYHLGKKHTSATYETHVLLYPY
ncbi:hypothetical protein COY28_07055, partial [Candidatus Woesearchaeota archaeon CG_4_10_14_0_2_um_filter_57_5]